MQIGIFTNCYKPLVNGVVGAVTLLRKGFLEAGHQVYIFTPAYDHFRDEEDGIFRYPAVDLTTKVKYPVAIPWSPRISRQLAGLRLDIVHSHHPFVLGPLARRVARRKGIPAVYTFHTQYDQYTHYVPLPAELVKWSAKRQVRRFAKTVDGITTPAESARQILIGYGVDRPIAVIPNPTDLSKFQSGDGRKIREQYGLGGEKLLVNIGRVAPEKNLSLLLAAFQRMIAQAPQGTLKLMIVGDGPALQPLIREAEERGLGDRVIFTGMVHPDAIPDYLAAADLFVMTSTSEVKPMAQLEALAAGVPIVAVAAAGANDTIEHDRNGLLTPEDAEAFAAAVVGLAYDEWKYRSFGKAAQRTADAYSYRRIAGEYLETFGRLIHDMKRC
ncbi:1,2-diacylglycerol 3-glucosyltransferase [Hydrogenispora ethanolica]|uniref:1,2-diacylglycerol 3-glucosyltransferase n=1 Tax=Hydrogenispora ethanolica TaxID=1082276 RepID=A0A4R1S083_HYDET|nr:glycosyltransferase family 4 protein [Hydrogenispora ethanolica]TCL72319.1 1,2-diacylglycerol 3-glucosyltransferase [Hydrogenispora ethanolica]